MEIPKKNVIRVTCPPMPLSLLLKAARILESDSIITSKLCRMSSITNVVFDCIIFSAADDVSSVIPQFCMSSAGEQNY